jgi:ABC-type transporter Mla MlaB component
MTKSTFHYKSTIEKETNTQRIVLKGDLSIRNAVNIKKKIRATKLTKENVKIQIIDVDNVDLTFIQLLISLKNSLIELGKNVEISSELPENAELLIRNSGFNKVMNTI